MRPPSFLNVISFILPMCSMAIDLLGTLISPGVNSWNLFFARKTNCSFYSSKFIAKKLLIWFSENSFNFFLFVVKSTLSIPVLSFYCFCFSESSFSYSTVLQYSLLYWFLNGLTFGFYYSFYSFFWGRGYFL